MLAVLCGYLGQALTGSTQMTSSVKRPSPSSARSWARQRCPPGFAARDEPVGRAAGDRRRLVRIVELPDGRIGIVVGDCVGHALGAATVMGQLRSACRALLLQETSPAQTLAAMDRFAAAIPGGECSTVFCGILDPRTGGT